MKNELAIFYYFDVINYFIYQIVSLLVILDRIFYIEANVIVSGLMAYLYEMFMLEFNLIYKAEKLAYGHYTKQRQVSIKFE